MSDRGTWQAASLCAFGGFVSVPRRRYECCSLTASVGAGGNDEDNGRVFKNFCVCYNRLLVQ